MKYGFEREYFVRQKGVYVLCPGLIPQDASGLWAEARGTPSVNPMEAAFLLLAAECKLKRDARVQKVQLVLKDRESIDPELLRKSLRRGKKGPYQEKNLYGLDWPIGEQIVEARAGLHGHFSNELEYATVDNKGRLQSYKSTHNGFLDIPTLIRALDDEFEKEIRRAYRVKGMYELKGYGFEYRSLPATIDPRKVADVLWSL